MKKNELMIVLAIVAFIAIVGAVLYNLIMPLIPEEHEKEKTYMGFELLLKSAEFMKGKTTYQFTTQERSGEVEKVFFVTQDGEHAYIKETIFGVSREVFVQPGQPILCFNFFGERYCDLANDTREMIIVDGFKSVLFSDKRAESEKKKFELLEKSGGLEIHSAETSEVDGRECTLVNFTVNYTTLSLSDLQEIGLSPSDPAVSLVSRYDTTSCIADNGEVFSKQVSYFYNGQMIEEEFVLVDSDYENSNIPPQPENFTDLTPSFQRHYDIFNQYFTCLELYEKDKCLVSTAVHYLFPEMCEYSTDKDTCYGAYVSFTLDPAVCGRFEGEMKDHCFFTIALGKKDESFCSSIANETLGQECITSLAGNQTTSNQTE